MSEVCSACGGTFANLRDIGKLYKLCETCLPFEHIWGYYWCQRVSYSLGNMMKNELKLLHTEGAHKFVRLMHARQMFRQHLASMLEDIKEAILAVEVAEREEREERKRRSDEWFALASPMQQVSNLEHLFRINRALLAKKGI